MANKIPLPYAALATLLVRYRLLLMILSMVLATAASTGLSQFTLVGDLYAFFSDTNPEKVRLKNYTDNFTRGEPIMVFVSPPEAGVFSQQGLKMMADLSRDLWYTPYSIRVESLANHPRSVADGEDFYTERLIEEDRSYSPSEIEAIYQYALKQPGLEGSIINAAGSASMALLYVVMPTDRVAATKEIRSFYAELEARYAALYPDFKLYLLGPILIQDEMLQSVYTDMKLIAPAVCVIGMLLLWLMLRSWMGIAACLFTMWACVFSAMGLASFYGVAFNQTSITSGFMIFILAMAGCIHLSTSFLLIYNQLGDRRAALQKAIAENFEPVLLTNVTTAIGFLCLNTCDSQPFQDMGNVAALGVMLALLLTFTMLPALLWFVPRQAAGKNKLLLSVMGRIADHSLKHRRKWFYGLFLGGVITVPFIFSIEYENNPFDYFKKGTYIREASDFALTHMSGMDVIHYNLDTRKSYGVTEPEFLRQVDAFAEWARQQDVFIQVRSFADIVKAINQELHGGDPAEYRIPDSQEVIDHYLVLYEMSLQQGQSLNQVLSSGRDKLLLSIIVARIKNVELIAFEQRALAWMQEHTPLIATRGTGNALLFAHLGQYVAHNMIYGSLIALMAITLVLMLGFRSLRMGLLSLAPNAFPAAIVYGAWGMTVGEVNIASSFVFSLSLGIIVDDTVHFLSKYRNARLQGYHPEAAVRYCFETCGNALFITSAVLFFGLALFSLSVFTPNATIGYMMAPIVLIALIFDFMFLPHLLIAVDSWLIPNAQVQRDNSDVPEPEQSG